MITDVDKIQAKASAAIFFTATESGYEIALTVTKKCDERMEAIAMEAFKLVRENTSGIIESVNFDFRLSDGEVQ